MLGHSPLVTLIALGGIWSFAVFSYGAVVPATWAACILALALTTILYVLVARKEWVPPMPAGLRWCLFLFPLYLVFQLLPLPLSVLALVSPAKAKVIEAVVPFIDQIRFEPLAVRPSATLFQLASAIAYLMVFLLARHLMVHLAGTWAIVAPIITVAIAQALFGIVECRLDGSSCDFVRGSYIDRNHFAGMLEMAFPFALMYGVNRLCRANPVWYSKLLPSAWIGLSLLGAGSILIAIFGSLSRMGSTVAALQLIAILAAVISFRWSSTRRAVGFGIAAVLLVAGVYLLTPDQLMTRFTEFLTPTTAALDRRSIWNQTLRMIKDYPIVGCGFGGYSFTYLKYKTELPLWSTDFAHNDYLQGLAELGIAGFAILAVLITTVAITAIRECSRSTEDDSRWLSFACVAALAGILLHSMVDFNLYIPANAMEFAWIGGVCSGLPYLRGHTPSRAATNSREIIAIGSPYREVVKCKAHL